MSVTDALSKTQVLDELPSSWRGCWTASPAVMASHLTRGAYLIPRHLDLLDEALVWASQTPDARLIVTMPPRHGKSETCSHWLPVWYLWWYPAHRIILCSYEADFASSWPKTRKRRTAGRQCRAAA